MKVVLLTGASSGIGYDLSKFLNDKGYKVYGLSRSSFDLEGITHIKADITNQLDITNAVNKVIEIEGKIDILINNAGMGISGSIEGTHIEELKKMFDVNFFGTFSVIKTVLPFMRSAGYGKILNVGSVASEFSIPFQTFYSATKSALKTFGEGLANEVSPYGINVCTILPGDIKTNFTKNRVKNQEEIETYKIRVDKSITLMEKDEQNGMTTSYASKVIYKVLKKKRMPIIKTIGKKYKLLVFLKRLLPTKLVNKLVGSIYGFKKD